MIVHRIPIGRFQSNAYVVACPETNRGVVVDSGEDGSGIARTAAEEGIEVEKILLTHGHVDHVGGLARLKEELEVPLLAHPDDRFLLEKAVEAGRMFGVTVEAPPMPDVEVAEGDRIEVGTLAFEVLHVPGHSPGHVAYAGPDNVFSGDVLFKGSIGRTDLPGGDFDELIRSIREKILPLGDGTVVWSGHGPETTVGQERQSNPFLLRT